MALSFEQVPDAIDRLFKRIDELEALIKQQAQPAPEQFMDVHEAGEFLRLSPQTIYGLIHRREIPHSKKGNRVYFQKSLLEKWLAEARRKTIKEIQEQA